MPAAARAHRQQPIMQIGPRQQQPAVAMRTKISLDTLTGAGEATAAQPKRTSLVGRPQQEAPPAPRQQARPTAARQTAFSVVQVAAGGNVVGNAAQSANNNMSSSHTVKPVGRPLSRGERPVNKLIAEAIQLRLAEEAAAEATRARLTAVSAAAAAARQRSAAAAAMTPRKRPAPSTVASTAASSPVPSPPHTRVHRQSEDAAPPVVSDPGSGPSGVDMRSEVGSDTAVPEASEPEREEASADAAEQGLAAAESGRAETKPEAATPSCSQTPMHHQPDGLRTPVRRPLRPVDMAAAAGSALLRHAIEGPMLHRHQGPAPAESPATGAGTPLMLPPWTPAGELA